MVHVSILISPYVEEIFEELEILLKADEVKGAYTGYPRTVALRTRVDGARQMLVATSKGVWPSVSFLQSWVIYARKTEFEARGAQASRLKRSTQKSEQKQ